MFKNTPVIHLSISGSVKRFMWVGDVKVGPQNMDISLPTNQSEDRKCEVHEDDVVRVISFQVF